MDKARASQSHPRINQSQPGSIYSPFLLKHSYLLLYEVANSYIFSSVHFRWPYNEAHKTLEKKSAHLK